MLAQNFMTPTALGISDLEFESLVKVLGMLERGEIERHNFNMNMLRTPCDTPACICGWASFVSQGGAFPEADKDNNYLLRDLLVRAHPKALQDLFAIGVGHRARKATPEQAAIALRSYLTTGEPRWAEALAE